MSDSDSLTPQSRSSVGLDPTVALAWLRAGWRDLWLQPLPSLAYGALVVVISWVVVACLFLLDMSAYLFPAIASFLIVGPILALGLYAKSQAIEQGKEVSLQAMVFVRAKSLSQIFFAGVLLCLLLALWIRAAVVIYALFFGLRPFTGLDQILPVVFGSIEGWALLVVGSAVGGLFAAFAFSISAFGIPMLFDRRLDVFTAMALSMRAVWRNLGLLLPWGAVVALLGGLSLVSGFLLMVIVFPLLGHATWHAYRAVFDSSELP